MNTPAATSSDVETKFKIEQNVPSGSARKGPYAVERRIDPNDVVIKRRFGEGSKPLFQRNDIAVNRELETAAAVVSSNLSTGTLQCTVTPCSKSSTESSSPERYRKRNNSESNRKTKHLVAATKVKFPTHLAPIKRRTPEKIPYFLDEVREKDRVRRIYGNTSASTSNRRRRSNSRSPCLQTPPSTNKSIKPTTIFGRHFRSHSGSRYGNRNTGPSHSRYQDVRDRRRKRSLSADSERQQSYSARSTAFHSNRRQHRSTRSRTKSRSRERDHRDYYERRHDASGERETRISNRPKRRGEYDHSAESMLQPMASQLPPPPTQFITIPVPVPDYSFTYPQWPPTPLPQHAWNAAAMPPRFAPPYAMMPLRPPPPPHYGMPVPPYGPRIFRPQQRYHNTRPSRGNFYLKNK